MKWGGVKSLGKYLSYCVLLLFLAQEKADALSVTDVLEELNENYPPLEQARLKLNSARGKVMEKQGAFDTKIKSKILGSPLGYYQNMQLDTVIEQPTPWWGATFFSGYRLGTGKIADYDGKKETLNLGEIRAGLELPLLRNREIDVARAELAALEIQWAISELNVFEKRLKFTKNALKTYWSWVAAKEKRQVAESLLALTQTRVAQLNFEIQHGKKPPVSALENQRALLKRQSKVLELQQEEQTQALDLSLFLKNVREPDQTDFSEFPLLKTCQNIRSEAVFAQALKQRPELLILDLQQAQNQIGLNLSHNQTLPHLGLFLTFSQDFGSGSKTKELFETDLGLNLEWPVQMRKAIGQVQQLEAERESLKLENTFLRNTIYTEIKQAEIALNTACLQARVAEEESELALKLAEAERDRFALGATDLFLVNLREQAAADARLRYYDALKNYYLTDTHFYLVQGLLPQSRAISRQDFK